MTVNEIILGMQMATCREELRAHLDLVQLALDNDQCDFDDIEWQLITSIGILKRDEFNCRVYH